MPTLLKSHQLDTGVTAGQIPVVSTAYKFTGTLAGSASVTLTLPAGTDPTLLIADLTILDTSVGQPTSNMWISGEGVIDIAKNATQIKLVNTTGTSTQYAVVLR